MIYHSSAEANLTNVYDGVLSFGYSSLFFLKHDSHITVIEHGGVRLLQRLTMLDANLAIEVGRRWCRDEIETLGDESVLEKHVVLTLRNDEEILFDVFAEQEPSFSIAVRASADSQTPALSERVEIYAVVSTHDFPVLRDYVAVFHRNILRKELSEIALAYKTYARAIFFLCDGNIEFKSKVSDLGFGEVTERKDYVTELVRRYLIEKIRLILVVVLGTKQIMHISVVSDSAIVSRGNEVRAEFACEVGKRAEFNLAIAKHVGIGRSAFFVLLDEKFEHVVHILLGKINRIIRDSDFVADILDVRPILLARATAVGIGFLPVGHIKPDYVKTLLFQKSSGNCAIYAARHTDDNTFFLFVHTEILAFCRQYVKHDDYISICFMNQPSSFVNLKSFTTRIASCSVSKSIASSSFSLKLTPSSTISDAYKFFFAFWITK